MKKRFNCPALISLFIGISIIVGVVLILGGCSQTIYNRETLIIDPNGTTTYERIHLGSTGVATAKTIKDLAIRTERGTIGLNRATVDNDSIKAVTPYGIIETE